MKKHKISNVITFLAIGLFIVSCKTEAKKFELPAPVQQIQLERVANMPNMPKPFKIIDFKNLAHNSFLQDFIATK